MLLVFGSINLDPSFTCARLPAPGETVRAEGCLMSPGGKGANQAHAAQRYGVPTWLVGAVGTDAFAAPALQGLRERGVDLSLL
jgi:ribokinase